MPDESNVFAKGDFDFICCERLAKSENGVRHSHAHYELVLTRKAGICFFANGEEHILRADTMVLLRPKDIHAFAVQDGGTGDYISILFPGEPAEAFLSYLDAGGEELRRKLLEAPMPPICVLTEQEQASLLDAVQRLGGAGEGQEENPRLLFRLFLAECIGILERKMAKAESKETGIPVWLETVCMAMRAHENFSEGLSRMVEISGKTREHLLRSMKKYKNMTGSEFINTLRLEYAAEKLIQSDESIVDLCYESGFTSLDHFGKQFKKKYGMAPSKFRALYKNG